MITLRRQKILFGVIIVLFLIKCENVCFGADKEIISMFNKQLLQAEDLWKAGKTHEYYLKAADIAEDIIAKSTTNNLNKIAAKLFDNLISKEAKLKGDSIELRREDLLVMRKLAFYLISNNTVPIKERRVNVLLLCKYLGKIRKEIVPNFKPKLVFANVSPPAGTPCRTSGMSPEAISDPVLRAQYEASIRENQENNLINSRQSDLSEISIITSMLIINYYIVETFHAGDISSALFTECINSGSFNDTEKEEIMTKVSFR